MPKYNSLKKAAAHGFSQRATSKGVAWFNDEGEQLTQPGAYTLEALNAALEHKALPSKPSPVYAYPGQTDRGFTEGPLLRDWIAGQALPALIAAGTDAGSSNWALAVKAYELADAMMQQRTITKQIPNSYE